MQELRQNTAVKVRIGCVVNVSDGFTPITNLTLSGADEAEVLKHNGVATVSISGSTMAAVSNADGWYDLTLTVSETDTLGLLDVVINDDSLILPVWKEFMVTTQNYWDSKYSTDYLQTDMVQMNGVSQTVTDLKDFADTGYDPVTHYVQGLVLCVSNTDMRGTNSAALETTLQSVVSDVNDIQAQVSIAGAGLTAIPWNANWDAEVESEVDDALGGGTGTALTAIPWNAAWNSPVLSECTNALGNYDPPTMAELISSLAALNDPTVGEIADAMWDEPTSGHTISETFGEQAKTDIDAILADTGTDGVVLPQGQADKVWGTATRALTNKDGFTISGTATKLDDLIIPDVSSIADKVWIEQVSDHSGTVGSTAEALAGAGAASDVSAIADKVWTEQVSDHSGTAGSTAESLAGAASAGDPWLTALPGSYGNGTAGKIMGTAIPDALIVAQADLDNPDQYKGGKSHHL